MSTGRLLSADDASPGAPDSVTSTPSPEESHLDAQDEFRTVLRRYFSDRFPIAEVRRLMETGSGYELQTWREMANALGVQGLIIPEQLGGAGFGQVELALVFEEMGRALVAVPLLSTAALATNALLLCDDPAARADYLPRIASGELVATVALDHGDERARGENVQARCVGRGWRLTGRRSFVLDPGADLLLVPAITEHGVSLFAVEQPAKGVTTQPLSTLDQTRRLGHLALADAPAAIIGAEGKAAELLGRTLDLAIVALVAEQVGAAQRVLERSVEYAGSRIQFGRAIGSFQAVKHECANMLMDVVTARAVASYAARTATGSAEELAVHAAVAKSYCSEAFVRVAGQMMQIHGGLGFTWEHDAHLYLRRAKMSQLLLGSPSHHRNRLGALLYGPPAAADVNATARGVALLGGAA